MQPRAVHTPIGLHDLPLDVICNIVLHSSFLTVHAASTVSACLHDACDLVRQHAAQQHDGDHLLPRTSARRELLERNIKLVVSSPLRGVVLCGGGSAELTGAKGFVRMGANGHTHCTGVRITSPVEVKGDVTLVGCHLEAGVVVASGGTLRLYACVVLSTPKHRTKCLLGTSLMAEATTFRTAASTGATDDAGTDASPASHLSASNARALSLRGCTFEGAVCTCAYVATSAIAMELLQVRDCTFRGGEAAHSGSGGLTVRLNGPLPRRIDLTRNQWLGRNLAITQGPQPSDESAEDSPVHAYPAGCGLAPFHGMLTVRCDANEFRGAALVATGAKLHVRMVAQAPSQLPTALAPARGATVTIHDGERCGLICKLFVLMGEYTYYQVRATCHSLRDLSCEDMRRAPGRVLTVCVSPCAAGPHRRPTPRCHYMSSRTTAHRRPKRPLRCSLSRTRTPFA